MNGDGVEPKHSTALWELNISCFISKLLKQRPDRTSPYYVYW